MTPQMFPIPPRMIMMRTRIEVENAKKSDVVAPRYEAWNAPATPAKLAPSAKASSFVRTVLTPIISAAVSSSRMAIQARPMREYWRLRATRTAMASMKIPR